MAATTSRAFRRTSRLYHFEAQPRLYTPGNRYEETAEFAYGCGDRDARERRHARGPVGSVSDEKRPAFAGRKSRSESARATDVRRPSRSAGLLDAGAVDEVSPQPCGR